ncbi:MAG: hypothetical protein CVU84_17210 [Firmicutes bacterium HGW-Firmicutes-1]|jgi:hypothetical protein|nr:MAG: hypothetical protein CVU84_17210 [Firmicutes bacterium HGW-Firmicutes-1]
MTLAVGVIASLYISWSELFLHIKAQWKLGAARKSVFYATALYIGVTCEHFHEHTHGHLRD